MKKTAIIGVVGVPAAYGGFETLVENILDERGEDYIVYCSSSSYGEKLASYKGARLIYMPISANGVGSIFYDSICAIDAVRRGVDTVLVLGVSGAFILPLIKILFGKKIVTNIDGLEWRRDKWSKFAKSFLKWSERVAVRYSDFIISDNDAIRDYIMYEYSIGSEVIAYGGDHVLVEPHSGMREGYAFGVCRIEPENNIHKILKAFADTGYPLKMVGNWESGEYGRGLRREFSTFKNLELINPVYDVRELFRLRDRCDFYVHGHSAGGTNPSLVEAMFFGKPIIAYDCVYNRFTMENKGRYFANVAELKSHIEYFKLNKTVFGEGEVLQEVAHTKYRWKYIRSQYRRLLFT
jgi:glycosyltransferase involved in cell wall biosynthesis